MNQLITFLLISIANWRICSLIQDEDGPFDIFLRLRNKIGLTKVEDLPLNEQLLYSNDKFIHDGNFFAKLVECIWCLSVWVGFGVTVYLGLAKIIKKPLIPIYALASSALTILISKNFGKWSD